MNADEIMNMLASREMDYHIRKEVFGRLSNVDNGFIVDDQIPHYSTDIAAAWEVMEKLFETDRYPTMHYGPDESLGEPTWWVELVNPADIDAHADTAPLAICRAALLATLPQDHHVHSA